MGERRSLQSMAWRARLPITDSARRLVWDTHLIAVLGTGGHEMEGTCVGVRYCGLLSLLRSRPVVRELMTGKGAL